MENETFILSVDLMTSRSTTTHKISISIFQITKLKIRYGFGVFVLLAINYLHRQLIELN